MRVDNLQRHGKALTERDSPSFCAPIGPSCAHGKRLHEGEPPPPGGGLDCIWSNSGCRTCYCMQSLACGRWLTRGGTGFFQSDCLGIDPELNASKNLFVHFHGFLNFFWRVAAPGAFPAPACTSTGATPEQLVLLAQQAHVLLLLPRELCVGGGVGAGRLGRGDGGGGRPPPVRRNRK